MGPSLIRPIIASLLLLALPLGAQDDSYQAKYQAHYKRFTRGDDQKVQDEAWGRLEWFRERMGGDLSPEFVQHLLTQAELERAKYPSHYPDPFGPERSAAVSGTTWTSLGPTGSAFTQNGYTLTYVDSGRLRVILPDTSDPSGNTVYVLAAGGGLWKTTNFLTNPPTWTALTDNVGSNMSGSAAFGRTTNVLYVGAGDPFDRGVGGFMIKSTDGGATWPSHAALGNATLVTDIKVDTSQAQDIILVGTETGLFRSANGGTSYAAVSSATGLVWSIVKTSAGWLLNTVASDGSGSLLLSEDLGATWSAIANAGTAYAGAGRTTLAVATPGDSTVYAYAAAKGTAPFGESTQQDLYRSSDGGQTWVALAITSKGALNATGNSDQPDLNLMHDQAWYNQMILVDPTDGSRNTVYLGGDLSSAKTTDGGATWTLLSNWLAQFGLPYIHADFHCAASTNFGGSPRLYFGGDGGLFTSTNGGGSWDDTKNKGMVNHLIYTLAANPGVPGSALVGVQDLGTRIRVGTTSTFNQVRGGDGFGVGWAQDVTTTSAVSMSSYTYNAIRRASISPVVDQTNWSTFTTGLGSTGSTDAGASYYFVTPIITPPSGADPTGQVFFTYGNGKAGPNSGKIFMSSGTGWTAIGTPGSGGISSGHYVRSVSHGLGISPTDLQHIAAAGASGYVLLSANGGSSWNEIFLGANDTNGNQAPGSLVNGWKGYNANIAWANNNLLYVCSESPLSSSIRVVKSANGGSTWAAAATGLPDVPITKLAVDPGDGTGNTVYAATWLGVYRTTDGGANWSVFGSGLPQGRATDIWVAPDSSSVRVATWGRGVWEMVNNAVSGTVSILPATAALFSGDQITFTGTVAGGGTVTYKATGGTITAAGTYTAGSTPGSYTVTATNTADASKTATANLTITAPIPVTFTTQPQNQTAPVGYTATFTVVASGSGTLTYQWKKNGAAISAATGPSYITPALTLGDSGSTYTCIVTGKAGPVTSSPALLTVRALGTAISVPSTQATAIPDATSTSSPGTPVDISFPLSGLTGSVGEVTFSIYLTHTYVADLVMTLIAPNGTSVLLSKNGGGPGGTTSTNGAAFGSSCGSYLVFSDLGAASIDNTLVSLTTPLVGTYRPSSPLSAFRGMSASAANGTWKLHIQDTGPQDTGSFNCGVLTVKPFASGPSLDLNGDGVVDLLDLLFLSKNWGLATANCDLNSDGTVNDADLSLLLAGL